MKKENAMNTAIAMYSKLNPSQHVVFGHNKKFYAPLLMNEKEFKLFVSKHPRTLIYAYHG